MDPSIRESILVLLPSSWTWEIGSHRGSSDDIAPASLADPYNRYDTEVAYAEPFAFVGGPGLGGAVLVASCSLSLQQVEG